MTDDETGTADTLFGYTGNPITFSEEEENNV